MKKSILCLLLISVISLSAQKINQAGHFIESDGALPAVLVAEKNDMSFEGKSFKGNTLYKSSKGFVSLDGNYENAPAHVFIYNEAGQLLRTNEYAATLNFKLSPNKKFCGFSDKKKLHILNLETYNEVDLNGSALFDIDDEGNAAYFNETTSQLTYTSFKKITTEPVSQIRLTPAGLAYATNHVVYLVEGGNEKVIFNAGSDRIFDLYSENGKLFICTRKKEKNGFRFTAYVASENGEFEPYQSTFYALKKKAEAVNKSASGTGEQVPNPLDYVGANPYQAIGNSYGEIQEYGGPPYPHPGVDLFGNHLDSVYSVKSGEVKAILTTAGFAHWRIAISNNAGAAASIGYLYAHLDQFSIPFLVGDPVNAGDVIGVLENFPVAGFVHCHFARIYDMGNVWNGAWWTLHDPLTFISTFADTSAPVFQKTMGNDVFAFRTSQGNYLSKDSLYGQVKVISKFYDLANSTWKLDVHKVRYSVSPLASPLVRLIDTLAFDYDFYIDTYFSSSYSNQLIGTVYSRDNTCFSTGHYNARDFYHIVSHTNGNDTLESSDGSELFTTTSLQNGSYIFRVEAWDARDNYAKDSIIFKIRNPVITGLSSERLPNVSVFPNPSSTGRFVLSAGEFAGQPYRVYDAVGKVVAGGKLINEMQLDLSDKEPGIYFLRVGADGTARVIKLIRN